MPDLPEVEIVRQSLLKNIKGKKINNGAKVVIIPKINPDKYDILIPKEIKKI